MKRGHHQYKCGDQVADRLAEEEEGPRAHRVQTDMDHLTRMDSASATQNVSLVVARVDMTAGVKKQGNGLRPLLPYADGYK